MQDCEHLARMMLELDEEETAEEDVKGTISEIANIIAGVVKSKALLAQARHPHGGVGAGHPGEPAGAPPIWSASAP